MTAPFPYIEGTHYVVQPNGCWRWLLGRKGKEAKAGGGYPCVSVRGKSEGAHRIVCAWKHGPLAPGMHASHSCHFTLCINPDHLKPATNLQNQQEGARALRKAQKLTPEAVRDIRARVAAGEFQRAVGADYGIAQGDVSHIVHRHWWAHVA